MYTCKVTHNSEEIKQNYDLCKDLSKPLVTVKKPHLRDIIKEKTVTATCSVEAPYNTEVSWLVNGLRRSATNTKTYKSPLSSTSQIFESNQTISREDWLRFKTIVCKATHSCFKVEEPVIEPVNIQKDPVVVIRRSFTGGSAVLECVVRDFPSGEVCITFQSGGVDISQVSCADVASSENIQSLTTDFTIPNDHQRKGKTFTCKVHSPSKQWTSKPTGNIFDNPTIELSVVPSVGELSLNSQKLVCSGTGFDPKIKWLLNSKVKSGVAVDVTIGEDGRLKVYSEMLVPQQDWNQGVIFKCEITDQRNAIDKSINICSAQDSSKPLIKVKKPHLRDIIKEKTVTATCSVEAPYNTEVSWLVNGVRRSATNTETYKSPLSSRSQIIKSIQTFSREEWLGFKTIVCKATHPCFKVEEPVIEPVNIQKDPVVVIRRSFTGGRGVLECVVRDLPSGEVCVSFQSGGVDISQVSCADVASSENIQSLTTDFTIPSEHQRKGKTFTCKVHSSSKQWTSKPTGNIFDNPTIELSVVPSVGELSLNSQKLVCSGTGFDPKIKWLLNSKVKSGVAVDVTIGEDGRLKVYSEMLVPQQDWNQGVIFTCEITDQPNAINKSINICSAQDSSKPLIKVKKPHLRDIMKEKTVTATCSVEAPNNTEVSWLVNGVKRSATNTETYKSPLSSRSQIIKSIQTFSREEWLGFKTIVCKATHPCFKVEEPVIEPVNIQKDPVVVIRRSFTGGSAVLECVVRDLPSGEVCITFQSGGVDISQVSCADVASSENIQSLTTDFTIPSDHQRKGKTFTCKVHSPSKQWTSKPTGNIFDNPTIELSVVPSVGETSLNSQKLVCSGTGFHPQIRWFLNFNVTSDTAVDVTIGEDGRLKVYSEMLVPQQDWNQGVIFTCEITDKHNAINKSINICSVANQSSQMADVYLLGPSLSDVRSMTDIFLTCLVIGHRIKDFTIQWKVDGHSSEMQGFIQQHQDHANGTQSMQSILKVPVSKWHDYSVFTCEAKPVCSEDTLEKNISKNRNPKEPTVRILKPSDSDLFVSQDASLLCSITGFFPSEISVQWQLNGTQLDESRFTNSPVVAHTAAEDFSIYSALILSASQWTKDVYSCVVSHESSKNPITATLEDLYASLTHSAPSAKLLQGSNELVCLAFGFSPSEITITWLLGFDEVSNQSVLITDPAKGPDGKFTIQSYLHLLPAKWAPGEVYRCRVTHITGTQLLNISKPEILEEGIYMNENKDESITQESLEDAWKMACAFLVLFLFSLFYGCTVTLVRVKTA